MLRFCDNLSFLLSVGWWKNKTLPFIYNVKFKKMKKALLYIKKPVLLVRNSDHPFGQNKVLQTEL